jgi:hypothetical protein
MSWFEMIHWLFSILRPAWEFWTQMETLNIPGKGLQNLGIYSALRAFGQEEIYIVPHLLWHGASVSQSHPKDRPI